MDGGSVMDVWPVIDGVPEMDAEPVMDRGACDGYRARYGAHGGTQHPSK